MNILLLAPQPFYAERGTPIAVRLLAESLCDMGHHVDLLTYPFGQDVEYPNLHIVRAARLPWIRSVPIGFSMNKIWMDIMLSGRLFSLARKGRYDVIHAVEESVFPALMLRWRHACPVIYDMDSSIPEQLDAQTRWGGWLSRLLNAAERWAIRHAAKVVAVSDDLADRARTYRDLRDVHVIQDVPLNEIRSEPVSERLADHVPENHLIALYVGNLETYQGMDLLLDGLEKLVPRDLAVSVLIIGGSETDIRHYRQQAGQRQIDKRLHFLGPRPVARLGGYLEQADILLSPRLSGGNTPMKIYTYMASGRPIIATRLKTHTQVLDEDCACLISATGQDLADALQTLAESPELRRRLGVAARARVEKHYSLEAYRQKLAAVYDSQQLQPLHAHAS